MKKASKTGITLKHRDQNANHKGYRMDWKHSTATLLAAGLAIAGGVEVQAQSFSIDDNPTLPLVSPVGFGYGAEDQFGLTPGPGLAPSPSLPLTIGGSGSMITPAIGGVEHMPGPAHIDGFSTNYFNPKILNQPSLRLDFSVDRLTGGAAGSASLSEFGFGQQPGDIYTSTAAFLNPAFFVGGLGPGPFGGVLPSAGGGGSNVLTMDESAFGLVNAGAIVPPGVPTGPITPGSHDNVDAFDWRPATGVPGIPFGAYATDSYFSVNPADAAVNGVSAADIFNTPAGAIAGGGLFAPAASMGLDAAGILNTDSIDALIMFDGGLMVGGQAEPGRDFALFSLAPGSMSLAPGVHTPVGLSPGDIFLTDFTGTFAVYAFDTDLGLLAGAPGFPFQNRSNVDALSVVPEPSSLALIALGLGAVARRRRG